MSEDPVSKFTDELRQALESQQSTSLIGEGPGTNNYQVSTSPTQVGRVRTGTSAAQNWAI